MAEVLLHQHALGAFAGVAVGDAMGMPTQTLNRAEIARLYGPISGFRDAVHEQPVSAGLPAGTITDDTEQSILLARHLIARNGHVDQHDWADELLAWERDTHARGVNDLLGPSTKRAIEALQRGVPVAEAGRQGTTNGAAMRIVPVAVATPAQPLAGLVDAVEESCRLTHHTSEAIGSASAVAAAVSCGVQGASLKEMLETALAAAELGERRGEPPREGWISQCIAAALALASRPGAESVSIAAEIGTSVSALQSIPMAFVILQLSAADPWAAALASAVIGDDTDTIGAIACGMAGSVAGVCAFPPSALALVCQVNGLDFDPLVSGLLHIRARRAGVVA